jgi:hypothetical protein
MNRPGPHATHAAVGAAEYLPGSHLVQLEPPGLDRVSVTEPAGHTLHSAAAAAMAAAGALYRPGAHGSHFDLAWLATVPAPQPRHSRAPAPLLCWPAPQPRQLAAPVLMGW